MFSYIALLLALPLLGSAQQWEIDFSDHEYTNAVSDGVLAPDGGVIAVGYMASDSIYYHPLLLHVHPDGSYKERVYYDIPYLSLTYLVKLNNGNYMALGTLMKEEFGLGIGALVFNDSLDIIAVNLFEHDSIATRTSNIKAIVDDDGSVVVCGTYEPISKPRRPFFYRFNEVGDILDCLFVEPSSEIWHFECHQILKDLQSDGYVVINTGRHGLCSITFYDRQFSEKGYVVPTSDGLHPLYVRFNSDKWLSDDRMLTFGHTWAYNKGYGWDLQLADISLDGTVNRYDNFCHTPDTSYNVSSKRCMAVVNDTTMYGLFYIYRAFKGSETNPGVCLFNKNMEVLGMRRFLDDRYRDMYSRSVVALPDGGCVLLCMRYNQYLDTDLFIIKMSREDLNPIPCSVNEVPQDKIKATAFPNPTNGELNIDISGLPENTENRVSITDLQGITRMSRIIQGSGNLLTIDASSLEAGVYFYSVFNKEKELIKGKFVKK